jgi:ketosteroid isomerase-like protein
MSLRRPLERHGLARLAPLLALFVLVGGCGARAGTAVPMARKRLWEAFFNRGDAVAGLYARNAELVLSGAAPIRGRSTIRAAVAKMVRSGVKVRIDTDRSAAVGDLAYFFGPYRVLLKRRVVEHGTYLEVWRRHGGRWLIELDVNATGTPILRRPRHWSYSGPPRRQAPR